MKKNVLILVVILVAATLGFAPARPDVIFTPTDDSYTNIFIDTPPTPPGFNGYGLVAEYSKQPDFLVTGRVYLRFDLSTLAADAPSGTEVRLHITDRYVSTVVGNLALWSTGDDWNGLTNGNGGENTLTWANAPAPIAKLDMRPPGAIGTDIVFSSAALNTYINSQRLANGGDNILSFAVEWDSNSCSACGMNDGIGFEDKENFGGTGHPPQLVIAGPTAVTMGPYEARPANRDIQVSWTTVNEADLSGFNLYRATGQGEARTRLNAGLIPADMGGQAIGSSYTFLDRDVHPGSAYYYWLQTVDRFGYSADYGPLQATAPQVIFLPILAK